MYWFYATLIAASIGGVFYAGYRYGTYLAQKAQKTIDTIKTEIKKL
jgi:hypothetical protein